MGVAIFLGAMIEIVAGVIIAAIVWDRRHGDRGGYLEPGAPTDKIIDMRGGLSMPDNNPPGGAF